MGSRPCVPDHLTATDSGPWRAVIERSIVERNKRIAAGTIEVADAVHAALAKIAAGVPAGT